MINNLTSVFIVLLCFVCACVCANVCFCVYVPNNSGLYRHTYHEPWIPALEVEHFSVGGLMDNVFVT